MKNLVLSLLLILVGYISSSCTNSHPSEAEKAVDQLISELEQILTQKYHMRLIGESVSMPRGIVKKLGIHFEIQGPLSKDSLRKILLYSAQDFIDHVNSNKIIKPYLDNYPFEIRNVEVILFLVDSTGYEIEHPYIGVAGIRKGAIDYSTSIIANNIPKDIIEEYESYEEALKIVQEQSSKKDSAATTIPNSQFEDTFFK